MVGNPERIPGKTWEDVGLEDVEKTNPSLKRSTLR